jgi:hypothetical protein
MLKTISAGRKAREPMLVGFLDPVEDALFLTDRLRRSGFSLLEKLEGARRSLVNTVSGIGDVKALVDQVVIGPDDWAHAR